MAKLAKMLILAGALAALALMAGFYVFANTVRGLAPPGRLMADGIVVLTGGDDRIAAGLQLMADGSGRRLLITGVHPGYPVPRALVGRGSAGNAAASCCIDLGYLAKNTVGNAAEAREWAETWRFRRLLIVTSSFHMPRSLAEFNRAMPDVELIAYPVSPRYGTDRAWWRHRETIRVLAGEYLKYLASAARLGVGRAAGVWGRSIYADHQAPPRTI